MNGDEWDMLRVSLGREKILSPACDLNDFLHPQGHEAVDDKSAPFLVGVWGGVLRRRPARAIAGTHPRPKGLRLASP